VGATDFESQKALGEMAGTSKQATDIVNTLEGSGALEGWKPGEAWAPTYKLQDYVVQTNNGGYAAKVKPGG
jgi:hypothetical protein